MDAVKLLTTQHRELEALLKKIEEADDKAKATLFTQAADQLTVHITAEEQLFYPAVRAKRTEDILLESLEEHLSLKRLLADLLALAASEQTFEPKFKVLKEQTEHHHEEEEEHLFPKVEKLLDESQRATLGDEMQALQKQLKQQGDPSAAVTEQTDAAAPLT